MLDQRNTDEVFWKGNVRFSALLKISIIKKGFEDGKTYR